MNIIINNMNTINSYDWHTRIAYIFVRHFAFLTVLTVNFCAMTAKFRTDTRVDHVQDRTYAFSHTAFQDGERATQS